MIKINLLVGKKPLDITNIGGFDLRQLNVKHFVLAILLSYVPDLFIYGSFEEELKTMNDEIAKNNNELTKLNKEVKNLEAIEKQIKALEVLDKQLQEKLGVVREIIKVNTNPVNVLVYIAKNIPEELWLNEITLESNLIKFKGESRSPKGIGDFMDNLKNSIFFRKDVRLPEFKTTNVGDLRIEQFTIEANVISYE